MHVYFVYILAQYRYILAQYRLKSLTRCLYRNFRNYMGNLSTVSDDFTEKIHRFKLCHL